MKSAEAFLAELNIKSGADLGVSSRTEPRQSDLDSGRLGAGAEIDDLEKQIEAKAVALLATREHGAKELKRKLLSKFPETSELLSEYHEVSGFIERLVEKVIETCRQNGWQSDDRYLEQAVRNYAEKGQGPLKIRQTLQQACSDSNLISAYLDWDESDWIELAQSVLEKKYGDCRRPAEQKELAKRVRFIQSRGFVPNTVWKAFK